MMIRNYNIQLLVPVFAVLYSVLLMGCESSITVETNLATTNWILTELNGQSLKLIEGQKAPQMVMNEDENRVSGFSGCNQFSGAYEEGRGQLQFGPLASTMMACSSGMDQEQAFLNALGQSKMFEISENDVLTIFDVDRKLILKFEADSVTD